MDRAQTKREAILALADGTRTAREIAKMVGCYHTYPYEVAPPELLRPVPRGPRPGAPLESRKVHRNRAMRALWNCGATCQEIAEQFSITRQRVHQILGRGID